MLLSYLARVQRAICANPCQRGADNRFRKATTTDSRTPSAYEVRDRKEKERDLRERERRGPAPGGGRTSGAPCGSCPPEAW